MKSAHFKYLPFIIITLFFFIPILIWIITTFSETGNDYSLIFSYWKPFLNTFYISITTSLFSVVLSYPLAFVWWQTENNFLKNLISIAVFAPVAFGLLTRNFAWIGLLSDENLINALSLNFNFFNSLLYTVKIVIVVMLYLFIPLSYFILIQGFQGVSRTTIDAGITMGANYSEILRKVVFPQTRRQTIIALFFIFSNSIGFYVTPKMLGGGKIDLVGNIIERYLILLGDFNSASIISMYLLITTIPLLIIAIINMLKTRTNQ